ncbi:ABC transporter permease [Clostridium sp. CCUG 7971]|uniref:FtsX-like permease family protein n=1 Tax=Clostridium sp. CCUG 7971 TaxID=2811414 RepID=UPI001ABAE078|nr:ABC transporter permease [Clostridium sp. CCUG 7971]MBO3446034.1 ABC transporter permease [Clostridium sp. CCUG 7971]
MNLFSISFKNVKNSASNYIMYFISIVFSVFIYFTFKSIQYNEVLSILGKTKRTGINSAAIVIAFFSFMFVYYSNAFFLNRRKKEIGTYSLLGMRKNQISKMFFYETLIISTFAIILGITLGFLFSKLMTMLLVKLMGEIVVVKMTLNIKSLASTIIVFYLIFTLIGIRNTFGIRQKKLIRLFKQEPEVKSYKKPSVLLGILGITLIIIGYIMATSKMLEMEIILAPLILIFIIPGTFLFFSSVLSIILNTIKKNKIFYYKGINLVAFSGLSYNIKSNSKILATIAILIATSVTILGFNISYYYTINQGIRENYKYSYNINAENDYVNKEVDKILEKYKNNITLDKTIELIDTETNYIDIMYYGIKQETRDNISIMKESDFVDIQYKEENYEKLKSDKYIYYSNDTYKKYRYKSLEGETLNIEKNKLKVQNEFYEPMVNEGSTYNIVVVRDNVYNKLEKDNESRKLRIINIKDMDSLELADKLVKVVENNIEKNYPFNITSNIKSHAETMQSGGLLLFIGMFLSAVFLPCTGSIILFKQLSSIYDDKNRYITLKKIGANNKDIEKILSKQLKLIFILPLLVGTIHNLFAMIIVQKLIQRNILVPILITLVIYYIGYFIYYLVTLKYAKDMLINEI